MVPTISTARKLEEELDELSIDDKRAHAYNQYSNDFVSPEDAAKMLEECRIKDTGENFVSPRMDCITWEEAHMALALLIAKRSKDPNTQVGALIVDKDNIQCGIGYNGLPRGCENDVFPWGKDKNKPFCNKYSYVCHAEANAIDNCHPGKLEGAVIFTTLFPCNECAKKIVQVGIKEVVYHSYKPDTEFQLAAKAIFYHSGVKLRRFKTDRESIVLKF